MTDSPRRWAALAAISLAVLVVGLDLTVLSLALPTIAAGFHASTGDLQWITDSYSLVLAALILPAGLLGDAYGRKKVLLAALVMFVACSVWCAYATSVGELIAARAVLGVGAAAVFPMALSVIPVMFGEAERQRAIAVMAAAIFVGYPVGPILGGFLLDHFWWGSVFLINVPVVALALIAVAVLLPESRAGRRPGFDVAGIVISSAGLIALTYGFIKAGEDGWSDAVALAVIGAGVCVLGVFVAWERSVMRRGHGQPLVDLPLFGLGGFRWGTALMTFVSFAMMGLFFTVPQYFQDVRGVGPLGSGTRLLPMIGGMMIGMGLGSRLSSVRKDKAGGELPPLVNAKVATGAGFLVMAAGLIMGALTAPGSSTGFAAAWIAIAGASLGIAMPSAMNAAMSPLTAERSGSGSALISAVRQVGGTIGVAVLGTLLSSGYTSQLPSEGVPGPLAATVRSGVAGGVEVARRLGSPALLAEVRSAFVHGMDVMLWTCGGIAVISALLALLFLPRQAGTMRSVAHVNLKVDINHHGSLRERKKARTRASLREHALRLFREQGYSETTVEQIAAAAEVSPSTFFRYFPTKEDVVLRDAFDERMFEIFERQPPSVPPVAALRVSIREALATLTPEEWAEFRESTALGMSVPEVRARMLDELTRTIARAAQSLAGRVGREPEDLAVRVLVGTVFGTLMAVMAPDVYLEGKIGPELFDRVDEALAMLESGLPL